jgi:hypothetical protein
MKNAEEDYFEKIYEDQVFMIFFPKSTCVFFDFAPNNVPTTGMVSVWKEFSQFLREKIRRVSLSPPLDVGNTVTVVCRNYRLHETTHQLTQNY